jgi:protein TonB
MSNGSVFILEDMHGAKPRRSVVLPATQVAAKCDVFAEAMLEKSSTRQKRHPLKWMASLGAHALVLFLLLLMPLYFSQGLDMHRLNMTLLIAPLPPAAAPPPPPAAIARAVHTAPKTFTPGKLMAPSFVPKAVAIANDAAQPEEALMAAPAGVPGGVPGGLAGGIPGGMMSGIAAPAAPVIAAEGPRKPVRVGGDVKPPRLLSGPAPVYPPLAKQSRIGGVVVIEAIIDEHGNVVELRAISGHPLLIPAAMKAVSQRKYEPTVLDGSATPVDLRVEVTFHAD